MINFIDLNGNFKYNYPELTNRMKFKKSDMMIMTIVLLCVLTTSNTKYLEISTAQIPDTPDFDDKTYFGFEYGTAGITFTLLDLVRTNILDNANYQLMEIVEETLNTTWDNRAEYENVLVVEMLVEQPARQFRNLGMENYFLDLLV